jgi:hypothetical protein
MAITVKLTNLSAEFPGPRAYVNVPLDFGTAEPANAKLVADIDFGWLEAQIQEPCDDEPGPRANLDEWPG